MFCKRAKNKIIRLLFKGSDRFRTSELSYARRKLLSSSALSDDEKDLLNKVSIQTHQKDAMYVPFAASHYLSVGLSALNCVEDALKKSERPDAVRRILNFACGYGRELRFLRARFPNAEITASEIDPKALDFCERIFSVKSVLSETDFSRLSLADKFDLIWCGSLITHLNERATTDLLRFFNAHLSPGGLCLFTTHGQLPVERMENGQSSYGLTAAAIQSLLLMYSETGYGFADYKNRQEYGISAVSNKRMLEIAREAGQWKELSFLERGWDNYQDVYGFILPS